MKRIISLVLTTVFILLCFNLTAGAAEPYTKTDLSVSGKIDYLIDTIGFSGSVDKKYYKDTNGSFEYSSYSLLNELQKKIYNYILNAGVGVLTIPMSFEENEFNVSYFTEDFFNAIMNAVALDNPQLFYFAGYGVNNAYTYSGTSFIAKFDYCVSMYGNVTYDEGALANYHDIMMDTMKNAPVDTSNRYKFVKSVHDYLCNIGTYPDLTTSDYTGNSHDAYGCLVEKKPVCQGYSDAFKLFCDYYKIPCVCISGTGNGGAHMWNAVQMDDGYWYLIDITWDDQEEYGTFYDFFLSGTDTTASYAFGYEVFKESHINDDDLLLPNLSYAKEKYNEVNHNTAFKATFNSRANYNGNYLIRSYFDNKNTSVYYNGMYVETDNLTTNGVFKVSSGADGNAENWTMVLVGDCDSDGACSVTDYSVAVNKVLADKGVSDASDMAADMDCDGCLDIIDLSLIQLATSGLNTDIKIE